MNARLFIPLAAALVATSVSAQDRIFRCGNEYTNNAVDAQARACKVVENGNVTVVHGGVSRPPAPAAAPVKVAAAPAAAPQGSQRIDAGEQRARDSDARAILEAELKKTESRYADLLKEFNNGEPEKQGPETRNHQKYLERVSDMKANIARLDGDIAGLKRELTRLSGAK